VDKENLNIKEREKKYKYKGVQNGAPGAIYGLGFLGASVYYLVHAATFWEGVIGILKAIFWPSFILYRVFELLKM